jgi:hypothetical protein
MNQENSKILSFAEAIEQLLYLERSNGWAVEYQKNIFVYRSTLIEAVIYLVGKHGKYPINKTIDDDFWFLIQKSPAGEYTLSETWESSMNNYKVDTISGGSLQEYAETLVGRMFQEHINKIRVNKY